MLIETALIFQIHFGQDIDVLVESALFHKMDYVLLQPYQIKIKPLDQQNSSTRYQDYTQE